MTDEKQIIENRRKEAAKRALLEAAERRRLQGEADRPTELGGRDGLEPTRYGDWEKKGILSDF